MKDNPVARCTNCNRVLLVFKSDDAFGEISMKCPRCSVWATVDLRDAYTSSSVPTLTSAHS